MRRVTKENLTAQIDRLRKIKDEQGQLSMNGEYTLQAYEMLLATMDSEPVELPLDYLQGHKDGLEWAAQLAEANHPETGDWLYDDPIELAKAIRKGPDMSPVQPVQPAPVENHIGSKNALDAIVSFIKGKSNPTVKCYEEVSEQLFKDNCHGIHSHVIEYILKLGEELEDLRAEQAEMQPVPDKWIPVSEQMPENKPGCYKYLVFETLNNRVNHDYWNVPDKGDEVFTPFWNHYGDHVTHWMPFPTFNQK